MLYAKYLSECWEVVRTEEVAQGPSELMVDQLRIGISWRLQLQHVCLGADQVEKGAFHRHSLRRTGMNIGSLMSL